MSLLSSIFGDATSSKKIESGIPDLFGNTTCIPPVLPCKTPSKAKAEDGTKGSSKPKEEGAKSGNDGDAFVTPSSSSDVNGEEDEGHEGLTEEQKERKRLDDEKRTIFVGNLPPDITRKALASIFKSCGTVSSTRLRSIPVSGTKLPPEQAGNQNLMRKVCVNTGKLLDDAPKKSAQGYVVFESESSLANALKLNNTSYQSHTIRVDYATPTIEPSKSVFVGNLPYAADEESLRQHFLNGLGEGDRKSLDDEEGEAVIGVRIIRDKETQKCKGFGYVTLRDASLVTQALQMHGTSYMKRELRVLVSGKRFKGKRGGASADKSQRRSFEGQRALNSSGSSGNKVGGKRKAVSTLSSGKTKTRRARSEKKSSQRPTAKAGVSKRAKTEQKISKRVKKLEKRSAKGMGKQKK